MIVILMLCCPQTQQHNCSACSITVTVHVCTSTLLILLFYVCIIEGSSADHGHSSTTTVGCRYPELKWCKDTPQLLLPQYIAAAFIFSFGYSTAELSAFTLYSKLFGPYPQVNLCMELEKKSVHNL